MYAYLNIILYAFSFCSLMGIDDVFFVCLSKMCIFFKGKKNNQSLFESVFSRWKKHNLLDVSNGARSH